MSDSYVDRTRDVRKGEALNEEQLAAYLADKLGVEQLGDTDTMHVRQFPGGYSNLTYLLKLGDRELVLRRPPFGSKVKRAHDMGREYRILSKLSALLSWVPKPILFCDDHAVIGADFYVMQRLTGIILRRSLPAGLVIDTDKARAMCNSLLDTFVQLHNVDYRAAGLADFGKPEGFVKRQVSGWTERYQHAKTDELAVMPFVAKWLASNMPDSPAPTIIHNDYKFDNVVYADDSLSDIIGVLDWELSTIGDPLMDLGTVLCYWIQADDHPGLKNLSFGPTTLPGMFTRDEVVAHYAKATGRDVSNVVFYYAFGLFKTAVVLQQIYYRYQQGLTQDPRFAALNMGVQLLAERARETIERQQL